MRNKTLDIAKFIGLFLMVLCHIPMAMGEFHQVVYSFHMPLFFFVSGLLFNPDKFNLYKGWRTLLLPYLIFNIVIIVLNAGLSYMLHSFTWKEVIQGLKGICIGSSVRQLGWYLPSGPSWFLTALFLVKISAKYILRLKNWLKVICIVIPIVFVLEFRQQWGWSLWSLDSAVLGSIFFYLAYFAKKFFMQLLSTDKSLYLLLPLAPITAISYLNGQADMYSCTWGNHFLLWLLFASCGSLCVILIARVLDIVVSPSSKAISIIMDGSMFLICMNIWLIDYISLAYRIISHDTNPLTWYIKLGITIFVFAIVYVATPILCRYFPASLGKNKIQK